MRNQAARQLREIRLSRRREQCFPKMMKGDKWIIETGLYAELSESEKDCLAMLQHHDGIRPQGAWPSVERMAAKLKRNTETISKALRTLTEKGILVERAMHGRSMAYHIVRDEEREADE